MDRLDNLAYTGVSNYFEIISKIGYKSDKGVNKLLIFLLIEDLIRGPLSIYICEEDYKSIVNALYCLFGSTCLIPYPEFIVDTSLIQKLKMDSPRITEDDILRFTQHGKFRLVNE